jgi:hypothetical protein
LNKREERQLIEAFEFEDQGHTFFCATETPKHAGLQTWWWFTLDSDRTTRYAPFEESLDDTQQSVQERIVTFYAELLAIRARPHRERMTWHRRQTET